MPNITLITVGTIKEKYLTDCISEYKKRLSAYSKIDEIEIKEERIINEDIESEITRALETEGDKILSQIPKDAIVIALCVEGKQYTSEELAKLIKDGCDASGKICLVIGSSHGLCDKVKKRADVRLSFSKLTFPHQLMRAVLYEALYRSFTIIAGKKYHK